MDAAAHPPPADSSRVYLPQRPQQSEVLRHSPSPLTPEGHPRLRDLLLPWLLGAPKVPPVPPAHPEVCNAVLWFAHGIWVTEARWASACSHTHGKRRARVPRGCQVGVLAPVLPWVVGRVLWQELLGPGRPLDSTRWHRSLLAKGGAPTSPALGVTGRQPIPPATQLNTQVRTGPSLLE